MNPKMSNHTIEKEIKELIEVLGDEDGQKRKSARERLVEIGEDTLHHIKDFLNHSKHIYRWEAMKVTKDIGSVKSIPVFLEALNDEKSDIRWIAAEGLIKTGKHAIKPLLNYVSENYDSVFVLNGAHHVLYELNEKEQTPKNFPADELLGLLKNPSKESSLKVLVHKILNELD
jgi:HEAT repeat protein